MKMKLALVTAFIIGVIALVGISFATEEKKAQPADQNVEAIEASAKAEKMVGKEISVRGVMEKTGSGLYLLDGEDTFLLKGDKALERMVGQPVEIKGVLHQSDKDMVILVSQAKFTQ
ncbi:MAG: hypothetical protein MI892_22645 [Desulfobacterales bacterium]|nr:hypothetical protein [Desulfobacterales bacterium]